MNRKRYVVFMDNDRAYELVDWYDDWLKESTAIEETWFEGPFRGLCEYKGHYPLSPTDIAEYVRENEWTQGLAIVELYTEANEKGELAGVHCDGIVSVNVYETPGKYLSLHDGWDSMAFRDAVNLTTDELGWKRPMLGISFAENKRCMRRSAYLEMLCLLANGTDEECLRALDSGLADTILGKEIYDKYLAGGFK